MVVVVPMIVVISVGSGGGSGDGGERKKKVMEDLVSVRVEYKQSERKCETEKGDKVKENLSTRTSTSALE